MTKLIETHLGQFIEEAKWAFSTRRVCRKDVARLNGNVEQARHGDLLLGQVQAIGSHKRLQLADGRHSQLYANDLVIAACGSRYAADQFEGLAKIDPQGADLLAGGGCIGRMRVKNKRIKTPTRIIPLGLLADAKGSTLNLSDYALPATPKPSGIRAIGLIGAGMNAGKTTAAAALIHGLKQAGYRVAGLKVTGTGAFGDYHAYLDAGANYVADFTDAGLVSTYMQRIDRLEQVVEDLLASAAQNGCDVAVVEFADGILQRETAALLRSPRVTRLLAGYLFAAPDAVAALGGRHGLKQIGLEIAALTGRISQSPVDVSEAEQATGLAVLSAQLLADPVPAAALLRSLGAATRARAAA